MTKEQMNVITGLIGGLELAIVHLANLQAKSMGITAEAMAASFESTAEATPESVQNHKLIQAVLNQIAAGVRGTGAGQEFDALMNRLLH